MLLKELAHARSGDKGRSVNIGVVGYDATCYQRLESHLTPDLVGDFFHHPKEKIKIYFWPKLFAINFVLEDVLKEGNLTPDSQGKAFATALLQMEIVC